MDKNVEAVVERILQRADVGLHKYGVTTERLDTNIIEWIEHLQCELFDASIYCERLKKEVTDYLKWEQNNKI